MQKEWDAVVIGGGFYGCITALYLKENGHNVIVLERGEDLLLRASYANQARVHNGYHYPRSFMTAWRSLINFPRFILDFKDCVDDSFEKVYAIARRNSKVSAFQFTQFCKNIDAPIKPAPSQIEKLFDPRLIEAVFVVQEYAFDAVRLREMMHKRLENAQVPVHFNTGVQSIHPFDSNRMMVTLADETQLHTRFTFNCTYAQINTVLEQSNFAVLPLKHQIAEIALVEVPEPLKRLGITVMDGPFFSVMPFPAHGLHSLSHVRYTHHETWFDEHDSARNPYAYLELHQPETYFPYMVRDAQRYLPILDQSRHIKSLFEIKTLLQQNEIDDGRPILFHESVELPGLFSVLGGKIDNIFDLLQNMRQFARQLS